MKKYFLTISTLSAITFSFGQSPFKKNDIYFELLGNGLFGSVNYERQLTKKPGPGLRIGLGFYAQNSPSVTFPVGINYLFKLKNIQYFIDAGFGVTWTRVHAKYFFSNVRYDYNSVNYIPSIGFRKHTKRNLMLRISFTPVANENIFVGWIGGSVGKRF